MPHGAESLPFPIGKTFVNGSYTIDSNDLPGLNLEGKEYVVEDMDYSVEPPAHRTGVGGRTRKVRIVRNVGAAALLPKRLVTFQASGYHYGQRVDGYADTTAERAYAIDEFLPAAGCPVNDLCYIVVEGPAMCLLPIAGSEFNGDLSIGSVLVALTAATSGATTAGRVVVQNITGSTQTADYSAIIANAQNYIGRALSAKTTGQTAGDILVDVGQW